MLRLSRKLCTTSMYLRIVSSSGIKIQSGDTRKKTDYEDRFLVSKTPWRPTPPRTLPTLDRNKILYHLTPNLFFENNFCYKQGMVDSTITFKKQIWSDRRFGCHCWLLLIGQHVPDSRWCPLRVHTTGTNQKYQLGTKPKTGNRGFPRSFGYSLEN